MPSVFQFVFHRNYNKAPVLLNFSSPLNRNYGFVSADAKGNEVFKIPINRNFPQRSRNKTEPFETDANEYFESRKVPEIRIYDEESQSAGSLDSRLTAEKSPSIFSVSSMLIDDLDTAISNSARSTPKWKAPPPADSHLLHPNWDEKHSGPLNFDDGNSALFGGFEMSDENFNNQEILEDLHWKLNDFLNKIENPLAAYSPAKDTTDFAELQERRRQEMTDGGFQQLQSIGPRGFDVTLMPNQSIGQADSDGTLNEEPINGNPLNLLEDFLDNPGVNPLEAYSPKRDVTDFATLKRRQDRGKSFDLSDLKTDYTHYLS